MRRKEYRKEYLKGTHHGHGGYHFSSEQFLQSRLGRKWSEVHSELSKHFDRRTYAGYAFWKWGLKWELATNCWVGAETGSIYTDGRFGPERVNGFYVHPHTGILSYQAALPVVKRVHETLRYVIDDHKAIEKITGIWYLTEYRKADSARHRAFYNAFYHPDAKDWVVLVKHQLSSEELRSHNLTNNTPEEIVVIKANEEEERKRYDSLWKAHLGG